MFLVKPHCPLDSTEPCVPTSKFIPVIFTILLLTIALISLFYWNCIRRPAGKTHRFDDEDDAEAAKHQSKAPITTAQISWPVSRPAAFNKSSLPQIPPPAVTSQPKRNSLSQPPPKRSPSASPTDETTLVPSSPQNTSRPQQSNEVNEYLKELDARFEPENHVRTQHEVELVLHGARAKKLPRPSGRKRKGEKAMRIPVRVLELEGRR